MRLWLAGYGFILSSAAAVFAQELTLQQIIQKIDSTENIGSSVAVIRQTIITSGGQQRTLEMKAYRKNHNEKQLLVYTAPRRVAGDKILMLNNGDDIWFYTPRTDRARHLASHARRQRVQGSDFAYEDLAAGKIETDYTYRLLGEENLQGSRCYQIELVPKPGGPHYSKLVLWAEKEKFITRRIDYYEEERVVKRLHCEDLRQIDGHWTAMRLVMENLLEGGKTTMELFDVQYDVALEDALFTTRALKKR